MSFRSYDLLNLVRDFGSSLTLRKLTTEGAYNPDTGSLSGGATTDYPFTGYFYDSKSDNSGMVVSGNRVCVVPALGLDAAPDERDLILGLGDTVVIDRVVTIYNNGVAVCYLCYVRE